MAAWTDDEFASAQVSAGTFSLVSRTVGTEAFAPHDSAASAAVLPLDATNLYPGESKAAFIQIKTTGTVPGTLQLTAVAPNAGAGANSAALLNALTVRMIPSSTAGDTPPACTIDTPGGVSSSLASVPALQAQQLEANGTNTVTYCVIVTLPADAPSDAQGGVVAPTWSFTGSTN